jgi:hypothetical protein
MVEVAVGPTPEAVPTHVDRRTKQLLVIEQRHDLGALVLGQDRLARGTAEVVQVAGHPFPVECVDPRGRWKVGGDGGHAAASSSSRVFLALAPPTYPPIAPLARTTRWQGTTTGSGLRAHAVPTARTAAGLPAAAATLP